MAQHDLIFVKNDASSGITFGEYLISKPAGSNYALTQNPSNGSLSWKQFEPAISKNTAFNKNFGTSAGTVAQGNDNRFHNQVSIASANGLSISGQALSLALATTSSAGAMSALDKTKLENSVAYTHPDGFSNQPASALSGASVISRISINNEGHVTGVSTRNLSASNIGAANSSHTHTPASTTLAGFMSAADKTKLNGIEQDASSTKVAGINNQGNSDYTLILSDAGKYIRINASNARQLTVPANANVPFAMGTVISIEQQGSGPITVEAASGVSVQAYESGQTTAGQFAIVQLIKTATNSWTLIGGVTSDEKPE